MKKTTDTQGRLVIEPGAVNVRPVANATPLLVDGYSLTSANAQPLIDLSGVWNTTATPTAIRLNVAEEGQGSGAASLLLDLQLDGGSKWKCDKTGKVTQAGVLQIANAGGKTTLELTSTAANTGLTIGGDTNIYRATANILASDDGLHLGPAGLTMPYLNSVTGDKIGLWGSDYGLGIQGGRLVAYIPSGGQFSIRLVSGSGNRSSGADSFNVDSTGKILLGSAQDTNLYRSAADTLKTDDALVVGETLTIVGYADKTTLAITSAESGTGLTLGGDTNLYRESENTLKTDDALTVTGNLRLDAADPNDPPSNSGSAPGSYFGGASTWLGLPDKWLRIVGNDGNTYAVPAYTPGT